MYKNFLVILLLMTGCTTMPVPVAVIQQPPPGANALVSALADSQIQASQMNQYLSGVLGPNTMSQALLDYQNANRELSAIAQNPWNGFFIIRNGWVK